MTKKLRTSSTIATIAAAAMVLVGCSSSGSSGGNADGVEPLTNPVAGSVPKGVLDGVTLTFASLGGTTQEAQKRIFFDPFADESGVDMQIDSTQSRAKIKAQVDSGNIQWDFLSTTGDSVERDCGVLYEPLDMSKIDTSHVPTNLLGATDCGVPFVSYATVLVYNTDEYGEKGPQSWADFFDTGKFPGTRTLYNGGGKINAPSVVAGAVAVGWDPKTDKWSMEWAEKGLAKVESIREHIVFHDTGAQAQQMLESGEAKMAGVWNGRALVAAQNGAPLKPVWNHWLADVDYVAIVKGSANAEAVYYAINYALGERQQTQWTEATGYSPLHDEAKPQLDELTRSYLSSGEDKVRTSVGLDLGFWSDSDGVAPLLSRWAALIAGA